MGYLKISVLSIVGLVSMSCSLGLKQSNGIFAPKLYRAILSNNPNDIVISPFSVHADLTMAYIGARGRTAAELAAALELRGRKRQVANSYRSLLAPLQASTSALKVVNKIYVQNGAEVNSRYNSTIARDFFSPVEQVDFANSPAAADTINKFVASHTNNLIRNLIDPSVLSASTQVVLVNAVYFKSAWKYPFHVQATWKQAFQTGVASSVQVDTMHLTKPLLYANLPELNAQIVRLAYKNEAYGLNMLLPNEMNGLSDLESRLVNVDLSSLTARMEHRLIALSMPKFKTTLTLSLNTPLQKLGINLAFTSAADFGDLLVDARNVAISDVVHQAYISVDEGGTEAAAATAIIMSRSAAFLPDEDPLNIQLNHPFFYYLEDHRQNVFFVGRYTGRI